MTDKKKVEDVKRLCEVRVKFLESAIADKRADLKDSLSHLALKAGDGKDLTSGNALQNAAKEAADIALLEARLSDAKEILEILKAE